MSSAGWFFWCGVDLGPMCSCIQLRVWLKLGHSRWSPLLQQSPHMTSTHIASWPGLQSMVAGLPIWEAKDAQPFNARVQKSQNIIFIAFSWSKAKHRVRPDSPWWQEWQEWQEFGAIIIHYIFLNQCVSTLANIDSQGLFPDILTPLVWGRTWILIKPLREFNMQLVPGNPKLWCLLLLCWYLNGFHLTEILCGLCLDKLPFWCLKGILSPDLFYFLTGQPETWEHSFTLNKPATDLKHQV